MQAGGHSSICSCHDPCICLVCYAPLHTWCMHDCKAWLILRVQLERPQWSLECYTGPSEGALTSIMSLSTGAFHCFTGLWWREGGAWNPGGPVSLPKSLTPHAAQVSKHERCINIFRTGVPLMKAAERWRKMETVTLAPACSSDCACCLWRTPRDHGFFNLHCE